jgi:hypothetical protein
MLMVLLLDELVVLPCDMSIVASERDRGVLAKRAVGGWQTCSSGGGERQRVWEGCCGLLMVFKEVERV